MKIKNISTGVLSVSLSFTLGCSVFRPSHQTLTVTTDPPSAQVWINGNYEGEAPVSKSVERNKLVAISIKKDGFEPLHRAVQYHMNTTGVLDSIGTYLFLLPLIGVVSPGSRSLDETEVEVRLAPATATNAPAATTP